jgi:hypothetical protein
MKQDESIIEHAALPFASASLELLATAVDILLRRAYARPQKSIISPGRLPTAGHDNLV